MSVVESSDPRTDVLAEAVIATLDGVPADELHALAEGFRFAGGPVGAFFNPVFSLAVEREDADEEHSWLATMQMRVALKEAARGGALLVRLEGSEMAFWVAVRDALEELQN